MLSPFFGEVGLCSCGSHDKQCKRPGRIAITSFGSRTEPMSIPNPSSGPSRESDTKQIDHNDSIRSTYFSLEDIKAMGASVAQNGVDKLPAFAPFDFFARHK